MPTWDFIEDASSETPRIWLSKALPASSASLSAEKRRLDTATTTCSTSNSSSAAAAAAAANANAAPATATDPSDDAQQEYKPLRKVDCRALNEQYNMITAAGVPTDSSTQLGTVLIESGRATANLDARTVYSNFYNMPRRRIIGAAWFTRVEKSSKEIVLHPLSERDGSKVEDLYREAVAASSSLSRVSLDDVIKEEILLEDETGYKVLIMKIGRTLTMKKKSTGLFGASYNLQRGYGEYTVPGEEDEVCLGPPRHLFFAVHGIGEAMWSRDDCSVPSVVAQTDEARAAMNRKQAEMWRADCARRTKAGETSLPPPPNRIEILPIEWYTNIHSASSELKRTLMAATLQNIPRLRAIANDVVFDVLMYLTPSFCEEVLETVTGQVIDIYERFHKIHPDFASGGGKCSLLGHSLGSVIVWDMLSILKDSTEGKPAFELEPGHAAAHEVYAKEDETSEDTVKSGTWGPLLTKKLDKLLPFVPEYSIFLGSPLGLFLSLRGAHPVFDKLRKTSDAARNKPRASGIDESLSSMVSEPDRGSRASPFSLPSGELYNIFHPADPVAYRIEPLLMPPGTPDRDIPPAAFLTPEGKGVRLHVQLQEATKNIGKSISGLLGQFDNAVVAAAATVSQEAERRLSSRRSSAANASQDEIKFALGGRTGRVDYQLQPGVIENEYLSAISAHGGYFCHEDLLDFLIGLSGKGKVKEDAKDEVGTGVKPTLKLAYS